MLTVDCVSAFFKRQNPFAGARNSRGIAEFPTDGVWAGEQAENCAGRGSARGEWVLSLRPPVSPERHIKCKTCLKSAGDWTDSWKHTFYFSHGEVQVFTNESGLSPHRRRSHGLKLGVCVLNVLLSSWVRYEEGAADTSRRDQDIGWSDSKKTEEWVLMDNERTACFFI